MSAGEAVLSAGIYCAVIRAVGRHQINLCSAKRNELLVLMSAVKILYVLMFSLL